MHIAFYFLISTLPVFILSNQETHLHTRLFSLFPSLSAGESFEDIAINFYLAASAVQVPSIYLVRVMNLATLRHNCVALLLLLNTSVNGLRVSINFPR